MVMGFQVAITITDEKVGNLLCSALEGGSNYWYDIVDFINPNNVKCEFKHLELPFMDGCGLMIQDDEGDEEPKLLNREAMQRGLEIMQRDYANHFQDFLDENDDGSTADVFLQCCLFGEAIYG